MARPKKPVLCTNCGGPAAAPAPAAATSGARAARTALYARYQVLGYQLCPTCKDYVNPEGHDCEGYQTVWAVTRSMDNFARAMASIWELGTLQSEPLDRDHPDYFRGREFSFRAADVLESITLMARACGHAPAEAAA